MPRRPAIEVEGLKELRKALDEAADDAQDLKDANREAGTVVVEEAKSLVPVLTGRLQASIRATGAKAGSTVVGGRASLVYAGVIHFGWPAHNIEPQPFLYDAVDRRRDEVMDRYQKAIDQIVDRLNS